RDCVISRFCDLKIAKSRNREITKLLSEGLDLDVHTRGQIELHQRIDRLLRGIEDVEQPLVRANLEGLARFLIDVRRPQHAVLVLDRRQRDRSCYLRSGAARGVHDLASGLVKNAVVISLQPDAYSLSYHVLSLKDLLRSVCRCVFKLRFNKFVSENRFKYCVSGNCVSTS